MVEVKYEVRYCPTRTGEMFEPCDVIPCSGRDEAYNLARELYRNPDNRMVEAWQIGTDGGDPATATGLIWSVGLVEAGIVEGI